MRKSTSRNENQLSFADLGIIEHAPATPPKKVRVSKKKAPTKSTTGNSDTSKALKDLLAVSETLASALQEKYEANLTAHREQPRVGISVNVEDIEALMTAISNANTAINTIN